MTTTEPSQNLCPICGRASTAVDGHETASTAAYTFVCDIGHASTITWRKPGEA